MFAQSATVGGFTSHTPLMGRDISEVVAHAETDHSWRIASSWRGPDVRNGRTAWQSILPDSPYVTMRPRSRDPLGALS